MTRGMVPRRESIDMTLKLRCGLALIGAALATASLDAIAIGETHLAHSNEPLAVAFGTWTPLLKLELEPGDYLLDASVALNNPNLVRVPVLCALGSHAAGWSETVVVQLESEFPQAEGRASAATLSPNFALSLPTGGIAMLICRSNGTGEAAIAAGRQMTATAVAKVTVQ